MYATKAIDFIGNIEEESVVFEPIFVNMYEKLEQLYNDTWVFPPWIKTILFEIKQLLSTYLDNSKENNIL